MSWLSSLFSGPKVNYTPSSFSTPGTSATFKNNKYTVSDSPAVTSDINSLSSLYKELGTKYGTLADQVTPGYNDLLKSQLTDINDTATRSIGNLAQNLRSRRILGSSFGNDTITRAQNEFAKTRAQTIADTFLKSLDANQQLIGKQYAANTQAVQTGLTQLNFDSSLAAQLASGANSAMASAAVAQAQLDAKAQAGVGSFIGSMLGPIGKVGSALGSGLTGMFGAGSAGAAGGAFGADLAPELMSLVAI
jgi:hypothetical protein